MKAISTYLHEDHNLGRQSQLFENIDRVQYLILETLNEALYSCEKYCDLDLSDLILSLAKQLTSANYKYEDQLEGEEEKRIYDLLIRLAKYKDATIFSHRDIEVILYCQGALEHIFSSIFYITTGDPHNIDSAWACLALANKELGGAQILLSPVITDFEALISKRNDEAVKIKSKLVARNSALLRVKNNPLAKAKNDAKIAIEIEWSSIPVSKKTYGWIAQFKRDMNDKFPILDDENTIREWVREWEKLPTS